ncbi:unnamed protein product [Enterobius vermicularis]|uniref:Clathrin assembly protein n=1 Tax=Enterobius vermicularis TaxID=51028 RepID=A0A0N4UUU8_ENTVE|nr:unnamed protein product [Enterobius vermicularis]
MADGLDCSCFGVAPNISANQQQQTLLQPQGLVGSQQMIHPNIAGLPMHSPFNTPLMQLQGMQTGPVFP